MSGIHAWGQLEGAVPAPPQRLPAGIGEPWGSGMTFAAAAAAEAASHDRLLSIPHPALDFAAGTCIAEVGVLQTWQHNLRRNAVQRLLGELGALRATSMRQSRKAHGVSSGRVYGTAALGCHGAPILCTELVALADALIIYPLLYPLLPW